MGVASSKKIIQKLGPPEEGFTDGELELIFRYFDKSGNGQLDKKEANKFFIKIVKYSDKGYTEADMPRWFEALDKDGSGELSRIEMKKSAVNERKQAKEAKVKEEAEAKKKFEDDAKNAKLIEAAAKSREEAAKKEREAKADADAKEAERKLAEETLRLAEQKSNELRLAEEAAAAERAKAAELNAAAEKAAADKAAADKAAADKAAADRAAADKLAQEANARALLEEEMEEKRLKDAAAANLLREQAIAQQQVALEKEVLEAQAKRLIRQAAERKAAEELAAELNQPLLATLPTLMITPDVAVDETDQRKGPLAFFFQTHRSIKLALSAFLSQLRQVQALVSQPTPAEGGPAVAELLAPVAAFFCDANKLISLHVVQQNRKLLPFLNSLSATTKLNGCVMNGKLLTRRFQDFLARSGLATALEAARDSDTLAKALAAAEVLVPAHEVLMQDIEALIELAAQCPGLSGLPVLKLVRGAVQGVDIASFQVPFTLRQLEAGAGVEDVRVYAKTVKLMMNPDAWTALLGQLQAFKCYSVLMEA